MSESNRLDLCCENSVFLFRATCVIVKAAFLKIIILHQKRRYQSDPIRNPIGILLTADLGSVSRGSRRFNLVCPFYNRETEGGCTFRVRGARLWSRIPLDMRKKDTTGAFKNALKRYLYRSSYVHNVFVFLNSTVVLRLYPIVFIKFYFSWCLFLYF